MVSFCSLQVECPTGKNHYNYNIFTLGLYLLKNEKVLFSKGFAAKPSQKLKSLPMGVTSLHIAELQLFMEGTNMKFEGKTRFSLSAAFQNDLSH